MASCHRLFSWGFRDYSNENPIRGKMRKNVLKIVVSLAVAGSWKGLATGWTLGSMGIVAMHKNCAEGVRLNVGQGLLENRHAFRIDVSASNAGI